MPKKALAAAANVEVPAYLALRRRGYTVRVEGGGTGKERWLAESDTHRLLGDGPLQLLGLAALLETLGDDWQASDAAIDDFLATHYPSTRRA